MLKYFFIFLYVTNTFSQDIYGLSGTKKILKKRAFSVVKIGSYSKDKLEFVGTGFFIDRKGTILTNYHVVEGFLNQAYDKIGVTTFFGDTPLIVSMIDCRQNKGKIDLCLLKTNFKSKDYIPVRQYKTKVGHKAFGLGMCARNYWAVREFTILEIFKDFDDKFNSSYNRQVDMMRVDILPCGNAYTVDGKVNGGDSGGPLFLKTDGKLVGVTSHHNINPETKEEFLMAIDVNEVYSFINKIHPYIKINSKKVFFDKSIDTRRPTREMHNRLEKMGVNLIEIGLDEFVKNANEVIKLKVSKKISKKTKTARELFQSVLDRMNGTN